MAQKVLSAHNNFTTIATHLIKSCGNGFYQTMSEKEPCAVFNVQLDPDVSPGTEFPDEPEVKM